MFFIMSKLLGFLLLPSNIIGLLGAVGILAWLVKRRGLSLASLASAALLLLICGWTPFGPAAVTALENRFPQPRITGVVAGVVMLGGAVDTHITSDRSSVTLNEAGERLVVAADLSRRYPDARIFLSGGANHIATDSSLTESQVARNVLIAIGVPAQRIEMEERSRNTCENGLESAAALRPRPEEQWLLVTSASHMPRAMACFRAAGFKVIPYPVDYRTRARVSLRRPVASIALGLEFSDLAAHEWLGLSTYRMFGLTTEWFPSP